MGKTNGVPPKNMVKSCAVFSCTQRCEKGISFHQFPGDKALLKRWLLVMKQQDWTPTKFSLICSRHFTDDCYEKNGCSNQRKLKPTAVPSIFTSSEKLDIRKKLRPRSVKNSSGITTVKNSTEPCSKDQTCSTPQMKKKKGRPPNKSSPQVKCSNSLKKTSQSELKMLQENNKLLKKKLSNLEALVKYLKEKSVAVKPSARRIKKKKRQ